MTTIESRAESKGSVETLYSSAFAGSPGWAGASRMSSGREERQRIEQWLERSLCAAASPASASESEVPLCTCPQTGAAETAAACGSTEPRQSTEA